jgi:DNA-dependent RNA polymerase auxiliary subunit epsilon
MWLRSRNGNLELKVPHHIQETSVNLYMEISNHNEIAALLKSTEIHVPFDQEISSAHLAKAGVQPFAEIETCRSRHKIQIDADTPDIPCSSFAVFVDIDQASC